MKGRSARLPIRIDDYAVYVGGRFSLSFQRTLRVPDAGLNYPVPPRLGNFRIHRVEDYLSTVPFSWTHLHDEGRASIFIPMYRREALWLAFGGVSWKPNAVVVGLSNANALSSGHLEMGLHNAPQNYIVSPHQPWLAGASSRGGRLRQFVVASPDFGLRAGLAQQGHDMAEETPTIDLMVYDPRPGIFPNDPPRALAGREDVVFEESVQPYRLGLDAGMRQNHATSPFPDPYGLETWESEPCARVAVHLVNIEQFRQITGHEPPHTSVTTDTYSAAGLPWLDDYEEK
jgi:hypothetical protein